MPVQVCSDTNGFSTEIYVFDITQQQSNPMLVLISSRRRENRESTQGVHVWTHKGFGDRENCIIQYSDSDLYALHTSFLAEKIYQNSNDLTLSKSSINKREAALILINAVSSSSRNSER